ncbi:MAG: D-alanine--poly(phosphoribitol) ligase subunit 2 [Deltaproteobacteria bacterium]|nr:D-alanine--poly(phosphoribitol) ligase subunit 2 [Deltaproteobacteria bacterium]
MRDLATLCSRIAVLFTEQVHVEAPPVDADLFESGLLDSLAFVDLLFCLEAELGIHVSLDDLEMENFRSIAKIAEFAAGKIKAAA